jgi:glyoxylase-like metal-dependent hydrolase (beta-lactamase superfamily II)
MSQSQLNQISDHIRWLPPDATTDRPILGAITGQRGTVIVDAGNSPAHAQLLLNGLAELNLPQPKFLILTHWHWDHVFGTAAFDCPITAYRETKRIVEEMAHLDWSDEALDQRVEAGLEIEFCRDMIKAEWPDRTQLTLKPPDISFADELQLDLGDVTCQISHVGGDHAVDSSIVYVPEDNILFLGDCLYQDLYYPQPNYTVQKLFPLIDRLLSYNADYYLLAHNPEPMSKVALVEFATLLKTIGQTVQQLGDQRVLILQALTETIGPLDDDQLELVDAFLVGLGKLVS